MTDRLFTVDEASALLSDVVPLLETIKAAADAMESLHEDVMSSVPTNGGGVAHARFIQASRDQDDAIVALNEMGILLREPATGLIDFPAERDGQSIFLCFRLGEDRIAFWHDTESGFSGRQPL